MKGIYGLIIFLAGVATGAVASWKVLKNNYEEQYESDIASIKESYKKKYENDISKETVVTVKTTEPNINKLHDNIAKNRKHVNYAELNPNHSREDRKNNRDEYSSIAKDYATETEKIDYSNVKPLSDDLEDMIEEDIARDDIEESKPYTIKPNEFGNSDMHDIQELLYYEPDAENPRGVLSDGWDPLTDEEIEAAVGSDYYTHFGEYEDSRVIIRNDERRMEYEIIKEYETYNEHLANE